MLRLISIAPCLVVFCHASGGFVSPDSGTASTEGREGPEAREGYDPLVIGGELAVRQLELEVQDAERERLVPIRVYLAAEEESLPEPKPVVLFSHGLGGSRENGAYLGEHWAARGYLAVFLQHAGSDREIFADTPLRDRFQVASQAASGKNLLLRVDDVDCVLEALAAWNDTEEHPLAGRCDLERVGMSGHSFGARTTQRVGGEASGGSADPRFGDGRIDAALAFSPSTPRFGRPSRVFGQVAIPWMLMTGTEDDSPIGGQTPKSRLEVYPHLPESVDRYELVLAGAQHSAFGDRALRPFEGERNPNHHRAIRALSTAFWDTHLRGDPAAREWLHGDGARGVLEEGDRWQQAPAQR